jgi:SAM-dependent methyltransferase
MRERYDAQARKYREDDERHAQEPDHVRMCTRLHRICERIGAPLDVLDLGCGTGRYFHCLENVKTLTGLDVSPEMLAQARNPLRWPRGEMAAAHFLCGDFYSAELRANQYHLIYSLGVFGNGCALTPGLANKVYAALRPGGCFLFDAIDVSFLPPLRRLRLRLRNRLHAMLPSRWQALWDAKSGWLPPFIPTRRDLLRLLEGNGFVRIELSSERANLPIGPGRKFECSAWKANSAS